MSIVEPAIDDGHPGAGSPRSRVPGLRAWIALGAHCDVKKVSLSPMLELLTPVALLAFPALRMRWLGSIQRITLSFPTASTPGIAAARSAKLGASDTTVATPACFEIFFTLPPAFWMRASRSAGGAASLNEIR